ncbi:MAG: CsgG/HfaB family protein, partial [Planctomycetota bacterium]
GVLTLAVVACGGCQMVEEFLNPTPKTGTTRVTPKLDEFPALPREQRKPVAVYEFTNKTGFPQGLKITNGMTEMLITALVRTKQFRVLDRAALDQLMTEKELQRSGETTGDVGQRKMTGAAILITGAVTELSQKDSAGFQLNKSLDLRFRTMTAEVALDMRVTDAATGEVIASVPIRKTLRKTGLAAGHKWGVSGDVQISNALDQAVRETLEEAVYRILQEQGVRQPARPSYVPSGPGDSP